MSMATTKGAVYKLGERMKTMGGWPSHWVDDMHEKDGGEDVIGIRPQIGNELLRKEVHLLKCQNKYNNAVRGFQRASEQLQIFHIGYGKMLNFKRRNQYSY